MFLIAALQDQTSLLADPCPTGEILDALSAAVCLLNVLAHYLFVLLVPMLVIGAVLFGVICAVGAKRL